MTRINQSDCSITSPNDPIFSGSSISYFLLHNRLPNLLLCFNIGCEYMLPVIGSQSELQACYSSLWLWHFFETFYFQWCNLYLLSSKGRPGAVQTPFVIGNNQACLELFWENVTLGLFCTFVAVLGLTTPRTFSQEVPCPWSNKSIYLGPCYKEKWCPNIHALERTGTCLKLKTSVDLWSFVHMDVTCSGLPGPWECLVNSQKYACRGD